MKAGVKINPVIFQVFDFRSYKFVKFVFNFFSNSMYECVMLYYFIPLLITFKRNKET